MDKLEFTHPATKAEFELLPGVKDRAVHQPGNEKHGEFSGMLLNIPPAVAFSMVEQGSNLIVRKGPATPAKPAKPD